MPSAMVAAAEDDRVRLCWLGGKSRAQLESWVRLSLFGSRVQRSVAESRVRLLAFGSQALRSDEDSRIQRSAGVSWEDWPSADFFLQDFEVVFPHCRVGLPNRASTSDSVHGSPHALNG